jgi:hypothetical protein
MLVHNLLILNCLALHSKLLLARGRQMPGKYFLIGSS